MQEVIERIKIKIKDKGITRVIRASNVSALVVYNFLRGRNITLHNYIKLCDVLEVDLMGNNIKEINEIY